MTTTPPPESPPDAASGKASGERPHAQTDSKPKSPFDSVLTPPLSPPPIGEVLQQLNALVNPSGLVEEVDRNARQLAQTALRKLDFVSREEFDAQTAILERTRNKVAALESELAALTDQVEELESRRG